MRKFYYYSDFDLLTELLIIWNKVKRLFKATKQLPRIDFDRSTNIMGIVFKPKEWYYAKGRDFDTIELTQGVFATYDMPTKTISEIEIWYDRVMLTPREKR
jgi:hypothetical protein